MISNVARNAKFANYINVKCRVKNSRNLNYIIGTLRARLSQKYEAA